MSRILEITVCEFVTVMHSSVHMLVYTNKGSSASK